ncbi:hypothetical protein [Bradyrhizobium sp.]
MFNSRKGICFVLAAIVAGTTAVYAQLPKPPGATAVEQAVTHPAETIQQVAPSAPHLSVEPPRVDRAPSLTLENHGVSVIVPGGPTKPVPALQSHGNGAIDPIVNNTNNTIQNAQNQLADAAKQGVQFPIKVAEDALKIVGEAAKKAIEDIAAAAKKALETQIDDLWKKYKLYVLLAGAALFAVLMCPALVAAWIVRRIGRKREKKMEVALEQAMKVIRAYAKEGGVKLTA